jgi:hypothetical protein
LIGVPDCTDSKDRSILSFPVGSSSKSSEQRKTRRDLEEEACPNNICNDSIQNEDFDSGLKELSNYRLLQMVSDGDRAVDGFIMYIYGNTTTYGNLKLRVFLLA